MENIGSWRAFADALSYADLPLTHFCRAELDSEPERVASVLEKLKEDCNNAEGKDRKSFQKELLTVCYTAIAFLSQLFYHCVIYLGRYKPSLPLCILLTQFAYPPFPSRSSIFLSVFVVTKTFFSSSLTARFLLTARKQLEAVVCTVLILLIVQQIIAVPASGSDRGRGVVECRILCPTRPSDLMCVYKRVLFSLCSNVCKIILWFVSLTNI